MIYYISNLVDGLMVKRLRRRPLTAQTRVRFPIRSPKKPAQTRVGFFGDFIVLNQIRSGEIPVRSAQRNGIASLRASKVTVTLSIKITLYIAQIIDIISLKSLPFFN